MNRSDALDDASYSFWETLRIVVCRYQYLLYLALIVELMLLLLAVLSLLFADLDAATRTILLLDFALLGVAILPTVGGLLACNRL